MRALPEFGLKLEAADAWQPDIQHQTTGRVGNLNDRELLRRAEGPCLQPHGVQKASDRFPRSFIVIDNKHRGLRGLGLLFEHVRSPAFNENEALNTHPAGADRGTIRRKRSTLRASCRL